jgi:hypothetical protein
LDASLGLEQAERLVGEGRQLSLADVAPAALDAIVETLASADAT